MIMVTDWSGSRFRIQGKLAIPLTSIRNERIGLGSSVL